jgi:hypothetical protein
VAGGCVADAGADLRDGEVCLGEQILGARGAQSRQIGVRRCARQFLEEAREVEGREIGCGGNLFQGKVTIQVRVHQFDGSTNAPVNKSDAR